MGLLSSGLRWVSVLSPSSEPSPLCLPALRRLVKTRPTGILSFCLSLAHVWNATPRSRGTHGISYPGNDHAARARQILTLIMKPLATINAFRTTSTSSRMAGSGSYLTPAGTTFLQFRKACIHLCLAGAGCSRIHIKGVLRHLFKGLSTKPTRGIINTRPQQQRQHPGAWASSSRADIRHKTDCKET
jgi:hypothetical protein